MNIALLEAAKAARAQQNGHTPTRQPQYSEAPQPQQLPQGGPAMMDPRIVNENLRRVAEAMGRDVKALGAAMGNMQQTVTALTQDNAALKQQLNGLMQQLQILSQAQAQPPRYQIVQPAPARTIAPAQANPLPTSQPQPLLKDVTPVPGPSQTDEADEASGTEEDAVWFAGDDSDEVEGEE